MLMVPACTLSMLDLMEQIVGWKTHSRIFIQCQFPCSMFCISVVHPLNILCIVPYDFRMLDLKLPFRFLFCFSSVTCWKKGLQHIANSSSCNSNSSSNKAIFLSMPMMIYKITTRKVPAAGTSFLLA